jgi:hypothetical protein
MVTTCGCVDADLLALLGHGAACVRVSKKGKVPIGHAWHTTATTSADTISEWLAKGYNVGILLGHGSIIDVEYDDAAGRKMLKRMGLADAQTPTYSSGRGEHRLFRLHGPLPCCGWVKAAGLEIRYGGKPAQSVLPPSRHPDGHAYRWTISPQACGLAVVTLADLNLGSIAWQ